MDDWVLDGERREGREGCGSPSSRRDSEECSVVGFAGRQRINSTLIRVSSHGN